MMLTQKEKARLRELAQRYAAAASLPEQSVRRAGWERFNMLESERPRALIDQLPWHSQVFQRCLIASARRAACLDLSLRCVSAFLVEVIGESDIIAF